MRIRLYTLITLLLVSFGFFISTTSSSERVITVELTHLTKDARTQVECLADNIYHEAGYEPDSGKVAVALVTLNRVQDPRYPKDICSVVKQKLNSTCQFTWWCENKITNRSKQAYENSKEIALYVYANYERMKDFTDGALFYHADYVRPNWKGLERTAVVGRHIFYKEKAKL
jgi:spore germination cell wall hydrolase CwlJ-like protein